MFSHCSKIWGKLRIATKSKMFRTSKSINFSILCVNQLFYRLFCLKLELIVEFQTQINVLLERHEDISVTKCKNSGFYLLEPLWSNSIAFRFRQAEFQATRTSPKKKNTANQVTGQPKCCPLREKGRSVSGPQ